MKSRNAKSRALLAAFSIIGIAAFIGGHPVEAAEPAPVTALPCMAVLDRFTAPNVLELGPFTVERRPKFWL